MHNHPTRTGLMQTGAWAVATGAAVALSWFGVHAVLTDAGFEDSRALTLPTSDDTSSPEAESTQRSPDTSPLVGPATQRPAPVPTSAAAPSTTPSPPPRPAAGTTPPATPAADRKPAALANGNVRSFSVPGGRVALEMLPDSAELISATPEAGWQMAVWHGDQWLRVDFSKGVNTNSVFVTWNGHPPDVQTVIR